jgi:hypothetical protein
VTTDPLERIEAEIDRDGAERTEREPCRPPAASPHTSQ